MTSLSNKTPSHILGKTGGRHFPGESHIIPCPGALLVSLLTSNKTWRTRNVKFRLWENYATFPHDVNEWFFHWVYEVIDGYLVFPIFVAFSRRFRNVTRNCTCRDRLRLLVISVIAYSHGIYNVSFLDMITDTSTDTVRLSSLDHCRNQSNTPKRHTKACM